MLNIRKSQDRGHANHGWLDSHHTFSFANYHDPRHMGFRDLRVINEDQVIGGAGFPTHPHRDMEIISYVVEGALEHKDSMGHGSVIRPGDVQRMSAGTGVTHSEFNSSSEAPLRFLQIWIRPEKTGLAPGYEQRNFSEADRKGRLRLVASPSGDDGSVTINQDAYLYSSLLEAGETVSHDVGSGRHAWLQVIDGGIVLNGEALSAGDGASLSDEASLAIQAQSKAHFLLFNLA